MVEVRRAVLTWDHQSSDVALAEYRYEGEWGLVISAGFKPVAGPRQAGWVGSIPTSRRQHLRSETIFQARRIAGEGRT